MLDIARIANVSESAVSRALQDHPRISVATKERVKKIAAELEFEYNVHARSLSTQKSGTIGIIVPNFGNEAHRSYYLDVLINDIRGNLVRSDYDLLIADNDAVAPGRSRGNLKRLVLQRKVDAFLILIADFPEAERKILAKRKVPVVVVNSIPLSMAEPTDEIPYFVTDNLIGGGLAADRLVSQGCRRLVCVADLQAGPEMVDRSSGFVNRLADHGLSAQVQRVPSDFRSTLGFVKANLDLFGASDGVFCHTDVMACAVLQGLQSAGIRVPEDVRLVGYDDIELGTYLTPRLTTIHQPRERIAELACSRLLGLLEGRQSQGTALVSVPPHLVVRESG